MNQSSSSSSSSIDFLSTLPLIDLKQNKNIWNERIAPLLKTDNESKVCYKGIPLELNEQNGGILIANGLPNCIVR